MLNYRHISQVTSQGLICQMAYCKIFCGDFRCFTAIVLFCEVLIPVNLYLHVVKHIRLVCAHCFFQSCVKYVMMVRYVQLFLSAV